MVIRNKEAKSALTALICSGIMAGFLSLSSCDLIQRPSGKEPVARVYNQYLYRSDLAGIVPENISSSDSTIIAERYIENWIQQQVLVREAGRSLPSSLLDFEKQIQDYKNSLIIYEWEKELILNQLDTFITEQEFADFYEQHMESFQLKESIVRIWYVKLPLDAPAHSDARDLIKSAEPTDIEELEEYCLQNAATYLLDADSWLIFSDLLREVPINTSNPESFLRGNSMIELTDDYYRYYLRILEYKLKGSTSPLAFERSNIRDIIISERKLQFMARKRSEMLQEAISSNNVETYLNN